MDPVTVGATVAVGGGLFVAKKLLSRSRSKDTSADIGDDEDVTQSAFVCERVCTSERLLQHMGALVRDPIRATCITVCGTSQQDACIDACQRAVCVNQHQVPAWNEACLKRCTVECTKGRAG